MKKILLYHRLNAFRKSFPYSCLSRLLQCLTVDLYYCLHLQILQLYWRRNGREKWRAKMRKLPFS